MAEKGPDFWNLDLTKLTFVGWLLILLSIGTLIGTLIAMAALLTALGFKRNVEDNRGNRMMAILAFIPSLGAASGVFLLGRMLLERMGLRITRER